MTARGSPIAVVLVLIVILGAAVFSWSLTVRAPPPAPTTTFGRAFDAGGLPLALGTPIRTFIDGVDYSNRTSVYDNLGSFIVDTLGNYVTPPTLSIKEGGDAGDAIMYTSGDLAAAPAGAVFRETASWIDGGFLNQDLNLAATQPALLKIQDLALRPSDGGDQYVYLCNPTTNPVNAAGYYLQKDVPGSFNGPIWAITGTINPGGRLYIDLVGPSTLGNGGDALKLIWTNPGGPGAPNGGAAVIVDRVEFNATTAGTLFWEPGNTMMTDALAPGLGQDIHRDANCRDTNAGADFVLGLELGRPVAPVVAVSYPNGGERFTGGTPHSVRWNMTDADPDNVLRVNASYALNGVSYTQFASGLSSTDPSSVAWNVPVADTSLARVLVCARDRTDLLGCDASNADFTIDSTAPTVQSTDPANSAVGVPLDKVLRIVFSEAMQPVGTSGFSLNPSPGPLTFTWVDARTLDVRHSTLLVGCARYTMALANTFLDASLPGNALVPASSVFDTLCAPNVQVTGPVGGEVFSGGSSQSITWQMSDEQANPFLTTWVNLSVNSGGSFPTPIEGATAHMEGSVSIPWTANPVDTTTARVQVCVQDETGLVTCDASPSDFAIDSTPPRVVGTSPLNGANDVLPSDCVKITFSEAMDTATVAVTFTPAPATVSTTWSGGNTIATVCHTPFATSPINVRVAGTSEDASQPGNPMGADYTFSFLLDTAPVVAVTSPAAGLCWCGGTSHPITWTMDDAESGAGGLVVYINASTTGGPGVVAGPLTGATSFTWTPPGINDAAVEILVTVIDPRGLSTTARSGLFRIDSIAPTLLSADPSDGSSGVPLNKIIRLTFSEPMDHASTESAVRMSPTPAGGITLAWMGNVLEIRTNGLASSTTYTVSFVAGAHDACDPGNALSPLSRAFTTVANGAPQAAFSSPAAAETWTVGSTKTVRWTITDETPAGQLRVWLNYTTASGTVTLVDGVLGATSFDWTVPAGAAGQTVTFHLDVTDPQGQRGSATSAPVTVPAAQGGADLLPWIGLLVAIAAIVGILLILLAKRRKKKEPGEAAPTESSGSGRPPR